MAEKVTGICTAYGGRLYSWPATASEAEKRFQELNAQLADSKVSQDAYDRFLRTEMDTLLAAPRFGGNSLIEDWRMALLVEKSIYTTLNLFEATEHTLKCDCWYSEKDEDHIRRVLIDESPPYGVSAMLIVDRAFYFADPHGGAHNPPTSALERSASSSRHRVHPQLPFSPVCGLGTLCRRGRVAQLR